MFVNSFEAICENHGIAPSRVLDNLGITRSAYTRWKNGGEPSNKTKKQIADHFGITVAELMRGETKIAPAQTSEDDEMAQLVARLTGGHSSNRMNKPFPSV